AIAGAISAAGCSAKNITHIILTHQDVDHIGCLKELLKLAPKARVMAHKDEAPYINGQKTPIKLEAMLKQYDSLPADRKAWCDNLKQKFPGLTVPVTHTLSDGEVLPLCGGIEVIHTPGHTPGHICLFLRKSKILVTGDALNVADGKLTGPNPQHTYDMELGLRSVEKTKKSPFTAVVSHHGGDLKLK
ncbi:MAG: MBL fold metallo-hydrolase, partial [Treponema sp.]|nr:MBL fold metallo-hydrolase [Treponema sp.]